MIHFLPRAVLAEGAKYRSGLMPEVAPSDHDAVQEELAKLEGSWLLVYWLYDGREQSAPGGRPVMSFAGDRFTIRIGQVVIERGRIEGLAPDRTPKPYDYVPTEANGKPVELKYPGIYLLQDDLFIACVGYRGERPRSFSAAAGSRHELVVYTRLQE
jgi:uncharacterized protein (TIGR03067 family)